MKKLFCLFLAAVCVLTGGCGGAGASHSSTEGQFFAMDTVMQVTVYGGDSGTVSSLGTEISRLEALFDPDIEGSDIKKINDAASEGTAAVVSTETASILETCLLVSSRTDGAFDITVRPVEAAWGFFDKNYRVPASAELSELLEKVGYENLNVIGTSVTLAGGGSLDLGAAAKGYLGDRLAEVAETDRVTSAIFELGGNVRAIGSRPDGSDWRVAVADPADTSKYVGVLSVSDTSVVTSGGYQRFFVSNGVTYHHIIDPATGFPADSGLISVTVVCRDGLMADCLSTSLYVMGLEKSLAYYNRYGGFEAVFVTGDGRVKVTDGLKDRFELSSGDYTVMK